MSKNAQFRAIQPSPSILSFVEENVILFHFLFMFEYRNYMPILSQDIPHALSHLAIILQLLGRRREIEFRRAGYNTELSVPLDNIPFSTSTERERIEETVCSSFLLLLL